MDKKLLTLLEKDSTMSLAQLSALLGEPEESVRSRIEELEKHKVILGYQAVIDWEKTQREAVTALIEVNVRPQRGNGYDRIAERIYQYEEVESCYLMSGSFDMTVIISGRSLREVAQFVANKLAPIEDVTGTATHFILQTYKEKNIVFNRQQVQEERFVFE